MRRALVLSTLVLLVQFIPCEQTASGCTIGVANGIVAEDERPLLWKSRVWSGGDNQIVYSPGEPYDYIGVKTTGATYTMMGLNSAGLCTGNSVVYSRGNGSLMCHILRNFSTVGEVRDYIDQEFNAGTLDATGCFPFTDADGNATMFEISYSNWYIEYDTLDPDRIPQDLYGWVVRANEFHENEDGTDNLATGGCYLTGRVNVTEMIGDNLLSAKTVMQGSNGAEGYEFMRYGPYRPLPTIAVSGVCSSMIVHGVSPTEDPALTTMWVALGQANYAIAVPTWVTVSDIPECLGTNGDMAALANLLYFQGNETDTQESVFPAEEHLFNEVEELLTRWRRSPHLALRDMARVETRMADDARSLLYCLAYVQNDNKAPTVSISISGQPTSYVSLSGRSVAIDNLRVLIPPHYEYKDDFSTHKAEKDSYDHSIFWPELAFPPPEPYLFYTHVIKPPGVLAFADYYGKPAHLTYCFPVKSEDGPWEIHKTTELGQAYGTMDLDVYDIGHGYASYSLSGNGVHWTLPMPLEFGHQKIRLITGRGLHHFTATAEDEDGTVDEILWDFGDGETATGAYVQHTYSTPGWYLVSCTVTDDDGVSVTDWQYCYVTGCLQQQTFLYEEPAGLRQWR